MLVALTVIAIAIVLGLIIKTLNDDPSKQLKSTFPRAQPATVHENGNDESRHFFLQIHGIYHHNRDGSDRQKIIRSCSPGELLTFTGEPDNPYDSNAVKVCRQTGEQLGYLDATSAMRMTHDMAIGLDLPCNSR
jgi:HIRAN domain